MKMRKIAIADASFERAPGQDGDVYTGNVVDQRHGGPVTIGYGRYAAGEVLENEEIAVHDTMIVLQGSLSVTSDGTTVTAGPGEMVYMPAGVRVTIRAQAEDVITAYVTYPHWQEAGG